MDETPAGPALDAEIAKRVTKLRKVERDNWHVRNVFAGQPSHLVDGYTRRVPSYSIDIALAWPLVAALADRYPTVMIEGLDQDWIDVSLMPPMGDEGDTLNGLGQTVPEAMCRAVLKAYDQE